jgi:hypothetical protein
MLSQNSALGKGLIYSWSNSCACIKTRVLYKKNTYPGAQSLNGPDQKRFMYRLLTRHDSLPVWLVADK